MLKTLLPYVVAFAAASIGIFGVRLAAGPERGARLAAVGIALGLIAALFFVPGFAWTATGSLNRIGHILIGALLVGALLDAVTLPKLWQWVLLAVFALGCGWASAVGTLFPKVAPTVEQLGLGVALGLVWLGLIVRFNALNAHKATNVVVLIAAVTGLAVLASIAGDRVLTTIALSLTSALFAFALCAIILNVALGALAVVPVAASLVAIAWALAQRHPETLFGLAVLALVLFAERTARRVPMPKGGIAAYLYLAVLAGFCAIPIAIAAVLVSATAAA